MGKSGVLCTLSEKRLRQLEASPDLVSELMEARHEVEVPGLLDLDKKWDALDCLLSERGRDALLGDVILARSGRTIGPELSFGKARVLSAARVVEISNALGKLPRDLVRVRYPSLFGKSVHGDYGREPSSADDTPYVREQVRERQDDEILDLGRALTRVSALYTRAAAAGHGMLAALV